MNTVNAISKYSGVSVHTIRYYSRIGLLKPGRDPENGYRVFEHSDLSRLNFIRRAQNLGFTLNEISEILDIAGEGDSPCQRVREILQQRIQENKMKIEHLVDLQSRMEKTFALWQTLSDGDSNSHSVCRLIDSANEALRPLGYKPTEEAHYV